MCARRSWIRGLAAMLLALGPFPAELVHASEEAGLVRAAAASSGPALGSIAAGSAHNCAVRRDGTIVCWGDNSFGQSSPPAGTFTQVAAGNWHSCGLKTDGTLVCWGDNRYGQTAAPRGTFTHIATGSYHNCGLRTDGTVACWGGDEFGEGMPPAGTFTLVAAGNYYNCGMRTDGTVACWGRDDNGQSSPPTGTFTHVAAGSIHTCGVRTDGSAVCWGDNRYGQSTPAGGAFTAVAAGGKYSCGLRANGTVACWGDSGFSQTASPTGTFTQITAKNKHTCALRTEGTLACWGYEGEGTTPPSGDSFSRRLLSAGLGHTCDLETDGTVSCWGDDSDAQAEPPAGTFTQVAAGGTHSCALKTDGTLACWGSNTDSRSTPPAGMFTQLAAGEHHSCALKTDGTIACWGYNTYYQCNPPTGTFTQVAVGAYHSCARKTDGTIACWGYDGFHQSEPPVGTITQIAAGGIHTCGLKTDGTIACWGHNGDAQSTPPTGAFTQVAAGDMHTCGLRTNGSLACWGRNDHGQSTPPAGTFTQIVAGGSHSCGVRTDGSLICWGDNSSGGVATVGFAAAASSGVESIASARINVVLSAASTKTITVRYATAGGTATSGRDFTATAGTLTFSPGQTVKTIAVPVVNDVLGDEGNENFTISLTSPANAILSRSAVHTYAILDEDTLGAIQFSSATYTVGEAGSAVKITVRRVGGASGRVGVGYATAGGTATAGVDFTSISNQLFWEDGEKGDKTFTVPVLEDGVDEVNETFTVALSPIADAQLGSPSTATVTILDNEPTPTVRFAAAASSGKESNQPRFDINLSAVSDRWVTFKYATTPGTAISGCDYQTISGTIGIAPGLTTTSLSPTIVHDTAVEANETFKITLAGPVNAALGSPSTHVYTILNDDFFGKIQLGRSEYVVNEAGTSLSITAQRVGGSSGEVSVKYATVNATATAGSDYDAKSGILTWEHGDTAEKTFIVSIRGDALDEADETFKVILSSATGGASLAAPSSAIVRIVDDDPTPTVQFDGPSSVGAESTSPAVMHVSLSAPSGQTVSVGYTTRNTLPAEALPGSDYTSVSGRLTFSPGQTTKTIAVPILNRSAKEPEESFLVSLSYPVNAILSGPVSAIYTILDDDSYGAIRLSAATYSVGEGGGSVTITAQRVGGAGSKVDVDFETVNGTAAAGSDYTSAMGTLSWGIDDKTNRSIVVKITNDQNDETDETFSVWLHAPSGGGVSGVPFRATVTIVDNDALPTVRFSEAASAGFESATPATFVATLSKASGKTVTVNYATANGTAMAAGDYTSVVGTLTFAPGETIKEIAVPIVPDSADEADENFVVTLGGPVNAVLGTPSRHAYTIVNDDPIRTLGFETTLSSGAESTTPAVFGVRLSPASSRTVTVRYATTGMGARAGSDFTAVSGMLTFAPGQTRRTISVPILNNTTPESDEMFRVTLSSPVNAILHPTNDMNTYTILDEDVYGAIRLGAPAYSVGEAGGSVTIAVQRVGGASGPVAVRWGGGGLSATTSSDFSFSGSGLLSWENGERANKTISVNIVDDPFDEPDETFDVRLDIAEGGAVLGSPARAIVTIMDNDPPPTVGFGAQSSSGWESEFATITVTLSPASGKTVTVNYATENGTATSGYDYMAQQGTLTFAPGVTSTTITVPVSFDMEMESDETFSVTLSGPVNATLGTPSQHVYTIYDEPFEPPPGPPGQPLPYADAEMAESRLPATSTVNDFDGDGRSDLGVFDPETGILSLHLSKGGAATSQWACAGGTPVTGDFDGDGRSDLAVFDAVRGSWSVCMSSEGTATMQFGSPCAMPVTGDFDGDGRSDLGVFDAAAGTWSLRIRAEEAVTVQVGSPGAVPVTGDFDGDGRSDIGLFDAAAGTWSLRTSARGTVTMQLGSDGAVPVTGDFDGDGVDDCGCFSPSTGIWEIDLSSGGRRTETLGSAGAIPVVGDFDGDGTSDIGCFYPAVPAEGNAQEDASGSWQILRSSAGFTTESLGGLGAIPIGGPLR